MAQTISVSLPSNTLYVSGTVNGVATTWTNTEGNTWETVAEVSADGKYLVELTIISSTGTSATESIMLYYGLVSLITDRTAADKERALYLNRLWKEGKFTGTAEELAEWFTDLKGTYNAGDLNRVESAVDYLAGLLRELPEELKAYAAFLGVAWDAFFAVPYDPYAMNPTTKKDWTVEDFPTPTDMERYLSNVVLLRNALDYDTDDLPPSMEKLGIEGANAIEKALEGLDEAIKALRAQTMSNIELTALAFVYAGEVFAGEV